MRLGVVLVAIGLAFAGIPSATAKPAPADKPDPLLRARLLYNEGKYDEAIVAAQQAHATPAKVASADLISARSYLERYRQTAQMTDLITARDRLRRIDPDRLVGAERLELVIGLGESLFLDNSIGAAAAIFEAILGRSDLGPDARERVLDWWASALDRQATGRSVFDRQAIYQRIRDRMRGELGTTPTSAAASYWMAAAARSQGDLQGAWDAAQAAWVLASVSGPRGVTLRVDLEDLVQRAIVPERARVLAQPPETLRTEWELFKEKWK